MLDGFFCKYTSTREASLFHHFFLLQKYFLKIFIKQPEADISAATAPKLC